LVWLDDVRDPCQYDWLNFAPIRGPYRVVWVKSHDDFVKELKAEWPDAVCFDHDLGDNGEPTGMDCAKWLVDYCLDKSLTLPAWSVHSANPAGADNIRSLLANFQAHQSVE